MKASVFVGVSLDGFMARRNGEFDFLPEGGGEPHGYVEFMASVDVLIIGRKTFEVVRAFKTWPYGEKLVVVLSHNPLARTPRGARVERMSGSPAEIVSKLSVRGLNHAYVDGGITIQSFINAGLVDRLIVTRVPVLIGDGIPLFGPVRDDIALQHVSTRAYKSGLVQSEYTFRTKSPRGNRMQEPDGRTKPKDSRPARTSDRATAAGAEKQLAGFIDKYAAPVARLARETRAALRKLLPTAIELVYDNYQFLAIGFAGTERASDCIASLAVSPKGVALSFPYGVSLPDPQKILLGAGNRNRYVRLESAATLATPAVRALVREAVAKAPAPLPSSGKGGLIIKSVSVKQRPRR